MRDDGERGGWSTLPTASAGATECGAGKAFGSGARPTCADGHMVSRSAAATAVIGHAACGLIGHAAALTTAFGSETLAKGLAGFRVRGFRPSSAQARAWRSLDAAAGFIKHPGRAAVVVADAIAFAHASGIAGPGDDASAPSADAVPLPRRLVDGLNFGSVPVGMDTVTMTVGSGDNGSAADTVMDDVAKTGAGGAASRSAQEEAYHLVAAAPQKGAAMKATEAGGSATPSANVMNAGGSAAGDRSGVPEGGDCGNNSVDKQPRGGGEEGREKRLRKGKGAGGAASPPANCNEAMAAGAAASGDGGVSRLANAYAAEINRLTEFYLVHAPEKTDIEIRDVVLRRCGRENWRLLLDLAIWEKYAKSPGLADLS